MSEHNEEPFQILKNYRQTQKITKKEKLKKPKQIKKTVQPKETQRNPPISQSNNNNNTQLLNQKLLQFCQMQYAQYPTRTVDHEDEYSPVYFNVLPTTPQGMIRRASKEEDDFKLQ